jgi:hypothetical protein
MLLFLYYVPFSKKNLPFSDFFAWDPSWGWDSYFFHVMPSYIEMLGFGE